MKYQDLVLDANVTVIKVTCTFCVQVELHQIIHFLYYRVSR